MSDNEVDFKAFVEAVRKTDLPKKSERATSHTSAVTDLTDLDTIRTSTEQRAAAAGKSDR